MDGAGDLARALDLVPLAISQVAALYTSKGAAELGGEVSRRILEKRTQEDGPFEHDIGTCVGMEGVECYTHDVADFVRPHPVEATLRRRSAGFDKLFRPTGDSSIGSRRLVNLPRTRRKRAVGAPVGVSRDQAATPTTAANPTSPTTNPITAQTRICTVGSKTM